MRIITNGSMNTISRLFFIIGQYADVKLIYDAKYKECQIDLITDNKHLINELKEFADEFNLSELGEFKLDGETITTIG